MKNFEKGCYLLAIYRASVVILESAEDEESRNLARMISTITVGVELILKLWAGESGSAVEDKVSELVERVGKNLLIADATKLIELVKKGTWESIGNVTINIEDD